MISELLIAGFVMLFIWVSRNLELPIKHTIGTKSFSSSFEGIGFSDSSEVFSGIDTGCTINPATGLPMAGDGCSGVDVGGNCYGSSSESFSDFGPSDFDNEW